MPRVLEVAGFPLAYEVSGSGPPVLFIQGVGVQGAGWRPQVQPLSARWTCLAFDNRGMAKSVPAAQRITVERMTEDALAIAGAEKCERFHVVGHSLGGLVAQFLALAPPASGREIAAAIPGARYVEIADASHAEPITHAAQINQLLESHGSAAR